jgi:nucleotide-binding universal stress UspA family protein
MYDRILVALEHSPSDAAVLGHVRGLARVCGSTLVFIHVADGWAARNLRNLHLRESEEMHEDRVYLERIASDLAAEGFTTEAVLATGEPAVEITAAADRERCSLIAMATHGHRFLADLFRGSVASEVRHRSMIPVLLVRSAAATSSTSPPRPEPTPR